MVVRLIKKKDIDKASKILIEEFYSKNEAKKYLQDKLKTKECFIFEKNKSILGIMIYERDYSHDANYLSDIFVGKNHRRKGISFKLLKKFIEISKKEIPREQKYALSSTHVTNKASIKMHLKFGFKKIGLLKGLHYGKDEIFFAYKLR